MGEIQAVGLALSHAGQQSEGMNNALKTLFE
jgi:hypothetical protein